MGKDFARRTRSRQRSSAATVQNCARPRPPRLRYRPREPSQATPGRSTPTRSLAGYVPRAISDQPIQLRDDTLICGDVAILPFRDETFDVSHVGRRLRTLS